MTKTGSMLGFGWCGGGWNDTRLHWSKRLALGRPIEKSLPGAPGGKAGGWCNPVPRRDGLAGGKKKNFLIRFQWLAVGVKRLKEGHR